MAYTKIMWRLFDLLFPPREDELMLRTVTDDTFLSQLTPRLVPLTHPATIALFSFSAPEIRAAIHEAKYHGSGRAFSLLARALAEYLADADELGSVPVLIPIPLSLKRRKERGYNQTEEVSRCALSGDTPSLDSTLLIRTRDTASQVSLARLEREKNMRGAFSATRPADPKRTYILLDDVTTTGATLQAAIDALRDAGAMHILPIALAH